MVHEVQLKLARRRCIHARIISVKASCRFPRIYVHLLLFLLLFACLTRPLPASASIISPETLNSFPDYTVAPGDTLRDIAIRYGTTVHALMQANNLQSPAHIYPGQILTLESLWTGEQGPLVKYNIPAGSTLLDVSRLTGLAWEHLAAANHVLYPVRVIAGYTLAVPLSRIGTEVALTEHQFPTAVSILEQLPLWTVVVLNPYPMFGGESLVVPESDVNLHPDKQTYPLLDITVNSQPLVRGSTAQFYLVAAEPVTCSLSVFDQEVPCYQDWSGIVEESRYTVLLGLSPLLDSGAYTATLSLQTLAGDYLDLQLPLLVATGHYDYERIDLPADRTALLDPSLSQLESEKIAALRTIRTTEKMWSLPFSMPFSGSVTSFYGARRSYGYGFTSFHGGTDFRAEIGDPVNSPASGTVVLAEPLVVRGNAVIIDHGWGVLSGYWHLSRIDVSVGQIVSRGDVIGAVGNTGLSTGPHLHWEMWVNGIAVSPLEWVRDDFGSLPVE